MSIFAETGFICVVNTRAPTHICTGTLSLDFPSMIHLVCWSNRRADLAGAERARRARRRIASEYTGGIVGCFRCGRVVQIVYFVVFRVIDGVGESGKYG